MPSKPLYKKIILKLSGEAFLGNLSFGVDPTATKEIAKEIISVHEHGVKICVVIGAGNLFRGETEVHRNGMDRATADYMGMLGTIINGMALQSTIESLGVETRLMTAFEIKAVAEPYIRRRAVHHLDKERIVIFGGGTGSPFVTTDTAAALRGLELNCQVLMKGTKVDGVYGKDPKKYPDAKLLKSLTFLKAVGDIDIRVMDRAAISMCMEHHLPVIVYNFFQKGNTKRVVFGEPIGTHIS